MLADVGLAWVSMHRAGGRNSLKDVSRNFENIQANWCKFHAGSAQVKNYSRMLAALIAILWLFGPGKGAPGSEELFVVVTFLRSYYFAFGISFAFSLPPKCVSVTYILSSRCVWCRASFARTKVPWVWKPSRCPDRF